MARLPQPGGDTGNWGDILNEFLGIAHNSDGTLKDTGVIANKYVLPGTGIPETDLSGAVQTKLNSGGAVSSVNGQTGAVTLAKSDVGLGNVDNTTDATKNSAVATLTNKTIDANGTGNSITNLETADFAVNVVDIDGTLAANSDTRFATQKAVKTYVDASGGNITALEAKTVPEAGGVMMRDPALSAWFTDLENTSNPVDLIVLGDSIALYGWVEQLENQLATRFNVRGDFKTVLPTPGFRSAEPPGNSLGTMTVVGGSSNSTGYAGFGTSLTNGQTATNTVICDGIIVVWAQGAGSLIVKDGGAGGTTVATIDTSTGSGKSNLTSIDLTTYASREIYIESSGNTQLEGFYPTTGNRTAGVRIWRIAHAGYTSTDFTSVPGRYVDFVNHLKALTGRQPHFLVATGFNDATASYLANVTALVQSVKSLTTGSVALWGPWGRGDGPVRSVLARQIAASEGLALIDSGRGIGDVSTYADANSYSNDGAHPNTNGVAAIATQALMVLSGDPLGVIAGLPSQNDYDFSGTFTTSSIGKIAFEVLFGYPYLSLHNAVTDAQAQILIGNQALATALLGVSSAIIGFGAGGASVADAFITRSAAGEFTIRQSSSVIGNIVTNLMRYGAGSPEASVTAPIGATYKDTTNGTLYIKTVGTGNTGWQAAAGTRAVNTQTGTTYTLLLADQGKVVTLSNAGAITLTVPTNTTAAFPIGTEFDIIQLGAGQVTVAGVDGTVTINSTPGLKISARYGRAKLLKTATNTWVLSGDLSA